MAGADSLPDGQHGRRRRPPADPEALVASARAGSARALARLISLVEDRSPELRPVMKAIAPLTGAARVIGLTGPPGVGKSTVTGALAAVCRAAGMRIGVLAVDPTSPFSGGALLGDRVRMQDHATDEGIFIRSMASRGHLGGLSLATPQALRILDAAGFDLVLIETVGVGQAELEIAALADSTLVIVAPGMGDSIQAAKAGILEIADILVVNKADRPGAQESVRDLRTMLSMGHWAAGQWKPPIVSTVASSGQGIDDLMARIEAHWSWLGSSAELVARRRARAREEVAAIAIAVMRERMGGLPGDSRLDDLAGRVAAGEIDPYSAADDLVSG
ncbi:MAG TPA: methylmalonyl Co-A mutase-associated GTPase MeaB [Streptosporangiaceae bacterium]|nr:methylmalonyl Co-A mutase-associated GTPase MeaB [Streptosporangiaceae bacterium]